MSQDRKYLLIVDDTEIDRIILKSILCTEFEILEASSGNMAFEFITSKRELLDAILLDISMPNIDGFDVMRFMEDKGINDIPVFLVTAEPTRANVEKALQYNVAEFIGKPFDKEDILRRLRSRLGVLPRYDLEKGDLTETLKYISDLEVFYRNYLANFGKNDAHYRIMTDLMEILLTNYNRLSRGSRLSEDNITLISKAAYFCDIGEMLIPDKRLQLLSGRTTSVQDLQRNHTEFGASLIRLNRSEKCSYFVEVCASMCLHHHERFDGKGYPSKIMGRNNSIFNQFCRLVDEFDQMRSKFYGDKAKPVSFVIKRLLHDDSGMVSPEVYSVLEDCEKQIFNYFMKKDV